jgi:hypothetical protein
MSAPLAHDTLAAQTLMGYMEEVYKEGQTEDA